MPALTLIVSLLCVYRHAPALRRGLKKKMHVFLSGAWCGLSRGAPHPAPPPGLSHTARFLLAPTLPSPPWQANNAYIFPALGHAALLAGARTLSDEIFLAAADALAALSTHEELVQGQ